MKLAATVFVGQALTQEVFGFESNKFSVRYRSVSLCFHFGDHQILSIQLDTMDIMVLRLCACPPRAVVCESIYSSLQMYFIYNNSTLQKICVFDFVFRQFLSISLLHSPFCHISSTAANLFQFLGKYRPETKKAKADRLKSQAAVEAKGEKADASSKPKFIKYGLNHVTSLIEAKKAKLVVIAHDVDPIELVIWLPTLCRKMNVPFVIVKGKARLGFLVHKKQASVLAITDVEKADQPKLQQLVDTAVLSFNNSVEKKAGGMKLSKRSIAAIALQKKKAVNTIRK